MFFLYQTDTPIHCLIKVMFEQATNLQIINDFFYEIYFRHIRILFLCKPFNDENKY